jgi:CRISPR/Cas system-associated exonuclease Cas4 (RecB family)
MLLEKYRGSDFSHVGMVFPGKRPALYIKKYLHDAIKSALIPPHIFSMDEFVFFLFKKLYPEFREGNTLDSAWFLYNCNARGELRLLEKENMHFSGFLPFATALLKSIDELDIELISDEKIKNLRYSGKEHISSIDTLGAIRKKFHDFLSTNKIATRGFSYKKVAEEISRCEIDEFKNLYFCGHFILTESEIKIVRTLMDNMNAHFYTQIEDMPDIFKNLLHKLNAEPEYIVNKEKITRKVRYYSAPDLHSEIGEAGQCLTENAYEPHETAIVLPDNQSLIPLLNNVMQRVNCEYNVTMGFPFSRTAHFKLIEDIIKCQQNQTKDGYYSSDYLDILLHPYVKNIGVNGNHRASQSIVYKIKELIISKKINFVKLYEIENGVIPGKGDIYSEAIKMLDTAGEGITVNELKHFLKEELHKHFFTNLENITTIASFISSLRKAFLKIIKSDKTLAYPLSRDIFLRVFEYLDNMMELSFINERIEKEEIYNIVLNILKHERIPFEGIPLKGLQILGLLETRNLMFKNIIFLDLNEGIVPSQEKYDPVLSIFIRKQLNLKTYYDQEQVYRYHFRRLIQGAENVHLFYIENDELIKSRFVEELIWEEQKKSGTLEVPEIKKISIDTVIGQFSSPEIKKDEHTMEKIIKKITERGLSPTSIDKYMDCPLSFFYSYVLGLEEPEKLSMDIEAKTIGSLVHKILEKFFTPFKDKKVIINDKIHREVFNQIINETFYEFFPYENRGELYLLKKVVQFRLDRFFTTFIKNAQIEVLDTEKELNAQFKINENLTVKLTGHIDRIEKRNGEYVVTDYKTGKIDDIKFNVDKLLELSRPLSREEAKKYIKSFQIPVYLYLLSKDIGVDDFAKLNASIYDIRENEECKLFRSPEKIPELMNTVLLPTLKNIVEEISSPHTTFVKDDSTERGCKFCSFPVLCRKF